MAQTDRLDYKHLLIGLGGTGIDLVKRIVTYQHNLFGNTAPLTEVVLIDSDRAALNNAEQDVSKLGIAAKTLFLSNDRALLVLGNPDDKTYRDQLDACGFIINDGFVDKRNVNRARKLLFEGRGEGARQTPTLSRAMYLSYWDFIGNQFKDCKNRLANVDRGDGGAKSVIGGEIHCAVFGSNFGGSGSGCILPCMYQLRKLFRTGVKLELWLVGSSFAFDLRDGDDENFVRRADRNAYQTLLELDIAQCDAAEKNPILGEKFGCEYAKFDEIRLIESSVFATPGGSVSFEFGKDRAARAYVELMRLAVSGGRSGEQQATYDLNSAEAEYCCHLSGKPRNYQSASASVLRYPGDAYESIFVEKYVESLCKKVLESRHYDIARVSLESPLDSYNSDIIAEAARQYREQNENIKDFNLDSSKTECSRLVAELVKKFRAKISEYYKARRQEILAHIAKLTSISIKETIDYLSTAIEDVERVKGETDSQKLQKIDLISLEAGTMSGFSKKKKREIYINAQREYTVLTVKRELQQYASSSLKLFLDELKDHLKKQNGKRDSIEALLKKSQTTLKNLESSEVAVQITDSEISAVKGRDFGVPDLENKTADFLMSGSEEIRKRLKKYLHNRASDVVSWLNSLLSDSESKQETENLIVNAFRKALPLFAIDGSQGASIMPPQSFGYCIIPCKSGSENSNLGKLGEVLKNLDINGKSSGSLCAPCFVPNARMDEIVFVHLLTGLRPNFATSFIEMKQTAIQFPSSLRGSLTDEREKFYIDSTKTIYHDYNFEDPEQL